MRSSFTSSIITILIERHYFFFRKLSFYASLTCITFYKPATYIKTCFITYDILQDVYKRQDLILIHESESSYQFTVEVLFHKGMFCYKNKACGFTPLWYVSDRCEVIGNAFDNPELMKEGVQPWICHIKPVVTISFLKSYWTVSYTHLDVYKRQL